MKKIFLHFLHFLQKKKTENVSEMTAEEKFEYERKKKKKILGSFNFFFFN